MRNKKLAEKIKRRKIEKKIKGICCHKHFPVIKTKYEFSKLIVVYLVKLKSEKIFQKQIIDILLLVTIDFELSTSDKIYRAINF